MKLKIRNLPFIVVSLTVSVQPAHDVDMSQQNLSPATSNVSGGLLKRNVYKPDLWFPVCVCRWYFALISVSGIFAVTFSVIFAYVADITEEQERSTAYGLVTAHHVCCSLMWELVCVFNKWSSSLIQRRQFQSCV